ncbi:MAG: 2-dehydropantoate 2-reductase [Gammaproteobacteria bacterium]|nr:2-dehydropantoate 2-reductase [Gammaproteobacteria bacterium]
MKICIYGAGAIGGYLGFRLADAGDAEVSFIARGRNLEVMRHAGLTLHENGGSRTIPVTATDDPSALGPQDYVIVAVKAPTGPEIVEPMQPLLGTDTAVVTAMNGVPWWYFHGLDGPWKERILYSVDPGGRQWHGIGPERAIGCVVYPAAELVEPGVVAHHYGDRFIVGEPSGEKTRRVLALSRAVADAGLKAPVRDIRDEIWVKLWGNLCFNPISALTTATLEDIAQDPGTHDVVRAMMVEGRTIGEAIGVSFKLDIEKRIDGAKSVGAHKTSMLQDLERGRPMEIDALLTVVQEMGALVSVPTPTIDTVLALVQQRGRMAGCY